MGKFVPQRAIDLLRMRNQSRVQRNDFLAIIRASGGRFEAGIPFHAKLPGDSIRA
jgi:hypothetical protein